MSQKREAFLRRLLGNQGGVAAVWLAFLLPLVLGMAGLVVDLGSVFISYRELQTSTDAAALAGAAQLPNATNAVNAAYQFSACATCATGSSAGYNRYPLLNKPIAVTNTTTTPTAGCVSAITTLPQCGSSIAANAIRVTQTTTIPTYFIKVLSVFGINSVKSLTITATSTAVMRGAQRGPYNVAIVMDTTRSMQSPDGGSNCTGTKAQCAEQGAQILLSEFSPCLPNTTCGTATNGNVANAVDEVSLFTFPAQTAGTQVTNDEGCTSNTPSVISYPDSTQLGSLTNLPTSANLATLVSEYQVVPLSSNYRTSDSTSGTNPLSTSSSPSSSSPSIVNAVGGDSYFGGTSCTGMQAQGGVSTFFGGALFTAQQYLAANARSNAQNVIILLSDGDANGGTMSAASKYLNSNGTYPSSIDQCEQAYQVAAAAKAAGTKIYTVGYGVASGGCEVDNGATGDNPPTGGSWTACTVLRDIASSDANFFVDTSSTTSGDCVHATSVTMNGKKNTLSGIFTAIVGDLSLPRLIPTSTAFTFTPN